MADTFESCIQVAIDKHRQIINEYETRIQELTANYDEEINVYKKRERQYITTITRIKAKINLKSRETQKLRELLKQYNIEIPPLKELISTDDLIKGKSSSDHKNDIATCSPSSKQSEEIKTTPVPVHSSTHLLQECKTTPTKTTLSTKQQATLSHKTTPTKTTLICSPPSTKRPIFSQEFKTTPTKTTPICFPPSTKRPIFSQEFKTTPTKTTPICSPPSTKRPIFSQEFQTTPTKTTPICSQTILSQELNSSLSGKSKTFTPTSSPSTKKLSLSLKRNRKGGDKTSQSSSSNCSSSLSSQNKIEEEENEEVLLIIEDTIPNKHNDRAKDILNNEETEETKMLVSKQCDLLENDDDDFTAAHEESVALFESRYVWEGDSSNSSTRSNSPSLLREQPDITMAMENIGSRYHTPVTPNKSDNISEPSCDDKSHDSKSCDMLSQPKSVNKRSRKNIPKRYPPKKHKPSFDQTTLTQHIKSANNVQCQDQQLNIIPPTPLIKPTSSKWQNELITAATKPMLSLSTVENSKHQEYNNKSNLRNDPVSRITRKAGLPPYKFVASFKKKDDRMKLKASACPECAKWYSNGSGDVNMEHLQQTCRHKHLHQPPMTDPSIWKIGFPDDSIES